MEVGDITLELQIPHVLLTQNMRLNWVTLLVLRQTAFTSPTQFISFLSKFQALNQIEIRRIKISGVSTEDDTSAQATRDFEPLPLRCVRTWSTEDHDHLGPTVLLSWSANARAPLVLEELKIEGSNASLLHHCCHTSLKLLSLMCTYT
jgi:hypothetical protein